MSAILADAASDTVTDSTERVNALGEKLFAVHPSGGRAQRTRRWARKHMPPGSSQEDYDKLVTPHMLWLTAVQLEARKAARDRVIALRRAKRRAKRELHHHSGNKVDHPSGSAGTNFRAEAYTTTKPPPRAAATHERAPIVRTEVLKGKHDRQAARRAKRAGRDLPNDVHRIIQIKGSGAADQLQLVDPPSEPAATSTSWAEDNRYIDTFVNNHRDVLLGLSEFTFRPVGWLYVDQEYLVDTPSTYYVCRISSVERSDQYIFPNVCPPIILAMRAAGLILVPLHDISATNVAEPVFGIVCESGSPQVDELAMHVAVKLAGKEPPHDKKAAIGVADESTNVVPESLNHIMSCERNAKEVTQTLRAPLSQTEQRHQAKPVALDTAASRRYRASRRRLRRDAANAKRRAMMGVS